VVTDELSVRVDIAFPRKKIAIFIDGCFWHSCPEHGNSPNRNIDYWEPKLRRNVERDRQVDSSLSADGWTVLRYWEHEPLSEVVGDFEFVISSQPSKVDPG
jgi:DNA mismatch endonuclease (patch repair protein)